MSFILGTFGILFTIFFVIGTHEAAHFFAARWCGVKVLRFSIGFGKTLWQWRDRKSTEYVIALIPLGGYVKMLDEREEVVDPSQLAYAYNRQPLYKKLLIVLAGPAMNLFSAFILYWLILMIGFTAFKPIIGHIAPRSIAAQSGLQSNQEILRINQERTPTWTKVLFRFLAHAGETKRIPIDTQDIKTHQLHTYFLDLSQWQLHGLAPDPLQSIGIEPYEPPIPLTIQTIVPNSPAALGGLKVGDKILKIHGFNISNWDDIIKLIVSLPNTTTTIKVLRDNKPLELTITFGQRSRFWQKPMGYLGIAPQIKFPDFMTHTVQYGPLPAIKFAYHEVRNLSYFNLLLFKKLLTGKLSLETLGGPITIFGTAGASINYNLVAFLGFLAFLSVSIGIINLFPIPGLDGGHVILLIIETIIGRPLPETVLNNLYRIGFLLLFFILAQAMLNDILRLY